MRLVPLTVALSLAACATRTPGYSEQCADPARPCTLAYDFEPSGAARDVFAPPEAQPQFLLLNEDGAIFRWQLGPKSEWDQDNVRLVRTLSDVLSKVEGAASAVCDGTPVLLASASFTAGRKGRAPRRERVVAVTGSLEAPVRVLENTSAAILSIAAGAGATQAKIEGLALSADCRTLYVGVRSMTFPAGEREQPAIYPVALDVDWKGTRETATLGAPLPFAITDPCSGAPEGISSLEVLPDGALLVLSSYEKELAKRVKPADVAQGALAGSLWRRAPDGTLARVACIPGHKPEALAVDPDGRQARVISEDDDYGGRPIGVTAAKVSVPSFQ